MKWDSFESHLLSSNYNLYHTKQFADVTLVSDDLVTFPAHKIVLSTSSKIFKSLLAISTNDQHPFLFLKDVMKEELEGILQYIYLGEANISEHRTDHFEMVMRYFGFNEMFGHIAKSSSDKLKSDKLDFLYPGEIEKNLFWDEKKNLDYLDNQADEMEGECNFEPRIQTYEEDNFPESVDNDVTYKEDIYENDKMEDTENNINLVQDFVKTEPLDKVKMQKKKSNEVQYRKKEEEPTECEMCNIRYTTKRSYQRHYKSVHELDRAECDECGKQFSTKDMVRKHKKVVHLKLRYQCQKCDKNFTEERYLRKHNWKLHSPKCESCKVSFADQTEFDNHIQQLKQRKVLFKTISDINCTVILHKKAYF